MAVAAGLPAVEPGLEQVRALAAEHNLIPLTHSFIDDCETPVSAFLKLREEGSKHPIEEVGKRLRSMMPWLAGGKS